MKMAVASFDPRPGEWSRNLSTMLDVIRLLAESHPAPDLVVLPGACDTGAPMAETSTVTTAMCQTFRESVATIAREWGIWIACGHACSRAEGLVQAASLFDPDGDAYIRPNPHEKASGAVQVIALPTFVADTPIGLLAVAAPDALSDPGLMQSAEPQQVDLIIACCPSADDPARREKAIAPLARKWQANLCLVSPANSNGQQLVRVLDFNGAPIQPASANSSAAWFGRIPIRFGGGRLSSRLIEEPPPEEVAGLE